MGDLPDWLQAMRGRREEPQRRPIVDPQVTARLRRDFGGDAFGQMGRDFRSGFDQMAVNARQGLPRRAVTALSNSGIPGWSGLGRARSEADGIAAGLHAPAQIPNNSNRVSLADALMGAGEADPAPAPSAPFIRRGLEPPNAPPRPTMAMQDAQALRDAVSRTQEIMSIEDADRTRRLPRPGQPLIAQAWADPNAGSLTGGLAGSRGRNGPSPARRRDRP